MSYSFRFCPDQVALTDAHGSPYTLLALFTSLDAGSPQFWKKVLSLCDFEILLIMKNILVAVMLVVVVAASWFYNGELTVWNAILAVLPTLFLIQSIFIAQNLRKAWGKATPDMSRTKSGMNTKILVWHYMFSTAILPFIWLTIFTIIGLLPLTSIIAFLSLPVAIACSQTVYNLLDGATGLLADIRDRSANLTIIFSLLLTAAFIIGRFI